MPALNFKQIFVPKILDRTKQSTIRKPGRIKVGDKLYLYTGMRTIQCTKIGTAVCSSISPITIQETTAKLLIGDRWHTFAGNALTHLFTNDGFTSYEAMRDFFKTQYGLPFNGELIEWRNLEPAQTIIPNT